MGGSIARALLSSGRVRVRAVARSVDSDAAKALAAAGAELAVADMANVDEVERAVAGASTVFLVTPCAPLCARPRPASPALTRRCVPSRSLA